MKKQLLTLLLACVASISASAYDFEVDGIYYNINGSEATVTYGDSEYTGSVAIPESVTYKGTTYSVTSIGGSAFYYCRALTSVTIPNSVTSIRDSAFGGCSALTSVTIPDFVTSIGGGAFYGCSSLTSVTIPNSVTSIGENAFQDTALYNDESNWENNVLYIGNHLINAKNDLLGACTIKEGTLIIADRAFHFCTGLTSVTIPDSVISIGNGAFSNCSDLTSVTIPDSVTSIGNWAFIFCDCLTSVTIPNSVTSIGINAFADTALYNDDSNWENNVLYIGNHFIRAKQGLSGACTIKEGTLTIAGLAFEYCKGLTSVTIPNSVISIGDSAFQYCTSLTSVTIPNSVTSIGENAFDGCSGLTSVTIPNSVTSIDDFAFYGCSGLTALTVENDNPDNIILGLYVFNKVPTDTCILYVPEGSKGLYAAANQWKDFMNIVGIDISGIEEVSNDEPASLEAPYYDLMGRRVKNPTHGIYIQNGKKILVK